MGKLQIKMEVNGVTQLNNGPYAKTQRKNISFTSNKVIKRYNRFNLSKSQEVNLSFHYYYFLKLFLKIIILVS